MSGQLPAEIGDLVDLEYLDLSYNRLSGPIPAEIGQLASLQTLDLDNSALSGPIPAEIGQLANLNVLRARFNNLSGPIPAEIGQLANLEDLYLANNALSGPIPAEIGQLANLQLLWLHDNDLSGPIPAEIGDLTYLSNLSVSANRLSGPIPAELARLNNLEYAYLENNTLSGAMPAELGRLTNLHYLDLDGNDFSGCVPVELSGLEGLSFDDELSYCAAPVVSVGSAVASEGDDAIVFAVTVAEPDSASGPSTAPEVTLDYETASAYATASRAAAGRDYTAVSGTLTIAAGTRRGTISVPLIDDDAAESVESVALRLTYPRGARLYRRGRRANASIIDDDLASADPAAPVSVCGDANVRAGAGDVFDVEQPEFSRWHHVFVDVDVTCGDLSSGVGYPAAVTVLEGPAASIAASRHCITQSFYGHRTASVAVAAGCPTSEPASSDEFTQDGRSTHIVWIPDAAVGHVHQLLVWVDLDRDGSHDRGEPYTYVDTDFVGRTGSDSTTVEYALPADFEIELLRGSTPVGRGGQDTELRLRMVALTGEAIQRSGSEPIVQQAPVANAPVDAFVSIGPSHTAHVMCLVTPTATVPSPNAANTCLTDADGVFIVRYRVPTSAVNLFRQQRDVVRVYLDRDQDHSHDHTPGQPGHEPSDTIGVPIAKAVNYIALGDSYSAGEAGDTPPTGAYQTGVSDADAQCRRWDQAYPRIFNREVLDNPQLAIDVTFATYACTGAITHNIHNPADPNGDSVDHHATNRPSDLFLRKTRNSAEN